MLPPPCSLSNVQLPKDLCKEGAAFKQCQVCAKFVCRSMVSVARKGNQIAHIEGENTILTIAHGLFCFWTPFNPASSVAKGCKDHNTAGRYRAVWLTIRRSLLLGHLGHLCHLGLLSAVPRLAHEVNKVMISSMYHIQKTQPHGLSIAVLLQLLRSTIRKPLCNVLGKSGMNVLAGPMMKPPLSPTPRTFSMVAVEGKTEQV
jgi:hypothetical protein